MSAVVNDIDQLVHFLKNVKLFAELSPDSLAKLGTCLKTAEFPPAEVIVREGAPGVSMYIIKSGLVEVRKKDPATGIDFLVAQLSEGAAVGEMSLLTGKPRSATVTTVQPTVVFTLTRADFRNLLTQHPEISIGLARILAERLEDATKAVGIEYVNLFKGKFDQRVVGLLPQSVCLLHKVVPISYVNNSVTLAMVNPANLVAFDDVRRYIKGAIIEPQVCTEDDFKKFMDTVYPDLMGIREEKRDADRKKEEDRERRKDERKKATPEFQMQSLEDLQNEILGGLEVQQEEEEKPSTTDLATASEDAPIVRLANNILALAIKKGASDIHIEPQEECVVLRLRIDGMLHIENKLSKKIQLPLASRFKILSRLDISERRLPQDGRISIKIESRSIDFRVSTVPAKFGEKIVMRILDKSGNLLPLDKIIVHGPTVEKLRWMINQPYGIIYVTGPTGSGKTTTLYSSLNEINSPDINILTAEDPIEYDLPGLCQVQTHKDIGLDFARILRAFLRQDPDVILVGETRDQETAKISVEAALTGHLVFTTLHTNDSSSSFTRLEEMGIEPFLMANSTIGILAQRLARRLCQNCKVQAEVDETTLGYFGYTRDNAPPFYKGEGCDKCNHTGKKGRVGIYELLTMNDELKRGVARGAKTDEIRDIARAAGMRTLKEYAMFIMAEGLTSVDEVLTNLVVGS
ncbi:MAG TPA: ATPase, T2SS/T4P/T4SS family [Terriglobia bacterium]|nr:ATPase, T2SS/T4P/T4SS family [Terriglobia bacterium]